MRQTPLALVLVALSVVGLSSSPAQSADIRQVDSPICGFALNGAIEPGDAEKLRAAIEARESAMHNAAVEGRDIVFVPPVLCLDSPDGSFSEGIALAEAVFGASKLETYVAAGAQCYSACALVFLAGSHAVEGERIPMRLMHVQSRLGLHAPFGVSGELSNPQAAANYFKAGLLAVKSLMQTLGQGLMPDSLRLEMLGHLGGEQDFFEIDTLDKAGRWGISLAGYRIPSSLTMRLVSQGCANAEAWSKDNSSSEVTTDYVPNSDKTRSGVRRIVIKEGFGAEGMSHCILVAKELGDKLFVDFAITEDAGYEGYPGNTPTWYMLPPQTKLADLPPGTGDDLSMSAEAAGNPDGGIHKNVITHATR
jgi:hypothetical protein